MTPTPTLGEFYDRWIQTKVEPLFRRGLIRDYRQCFNCYILPAFKSMRLGAINTKDLTDFRLALLREGLSVKTARNVIDGSFRAMYRDARAEIDELGRDPFIDIQWPANEKPKPDPFTVDERDRILNFFKEQEPFYYPWVFMPFTIGTRPSEAAGLLRTDIDVETCEISIIKSRYLGADGKPKTGRSRRTIRVPQLLIEVLLTLPSYGLDAERLFLNKFGGALDANQWAKDYWARILKALGIRHRKFYATRHTFITEAVKQGELLKAIADYCGTSVQMIEENYCGTLTLSDRTILAHSRSNYSEKLASPTGFEPVLSA